MKKSIRHLVYGKYNGKCGYCGNEIQYNNMQVDHISPKWSGGKDDIDNLMPTCRKCNHYKREKDLDGFRESMLTLHERVSSIYISKIAIDYGIVTIRPFNGKFYFETLQYDPD